MSLELSQDTCHRRVWRLLGGTNAAADVPNGVKAAAGPAEAFGQVTPLPVPGNGAIAVDIQPKLRWTRAPAVTGHKVASGETNPPKAAGETSGQTFDPGELKPGTNYYWRVDQVTPEGTVEGATWRFRTLSKKRSRPNSNGIAPISRGERDTTIMYTAGRQA